MSYTLTAIKTFTGREGQGLNAVLQRDGKDVAFILDEAQGGMMDIDFTNPRQNGKSYQKHKDNAAAESKLFGEFVAKWYVESGQQERDRKRHAEALAVCRIVKRRDADGEPDVDLEDVEVNRIWNTAWFYAKWEHLTAPKVTR